MEYKLVGNSSAVGVLRTSDGVLIQPFPDSQDFIQYQNWIAQGNKPFPLNMQVTAYQAKQALLQANLYSQANSAVYSSNNQSLIIAWENATVFERESPFILNIQPTLNLSNNQIDDLFISASKIT